MRAIIFTNFSLLLSVKYFFVFFLTLHDFPIFHLLFRRNRNLIFYFYCFPYKFCGQSKKQMNKSFTTKNCDFVINCKRIGGPQRESDSKRPEKKRQVSNDAKDDRRTSTLSIELGSMGHWIFGENTSNAFSIWTFKRPNKY